MNLKEELLHELNLVQNTKFNETNTLTNNTYFLDKDILLKENKSGDARIPFTKDGLTLWIHQNGNISLNESNFFIISESLEGESNFLSLFLGIKNKDKYNPYSLFEINKNIYEKDVTRFTIFKNSYALFILTINDLIYGARFSLTEEKDFIFEVSVINKGIETKDIYSSLFLNFNLTHSNHTSVETKWFKKCVYNDNYFTLSTVEDLSRYEHLYNTYYLFRDIDRKDVTILNTTSRGVYASSKTGFIENSESLVNGEFPINKLTTCFGDVSICGDIIKTSLKQDENLSISYILTYKFNKEISKNIPSLFLKNLQNSTNYYESNDFLKMKFESGENINGELFTSFINKVIYQVDYCARTKNSTLTMLGIRDVFQAIEAGLIRNKVDTKKKIIEALGFTNINGRLPRQYSLPIKGKDYSYIDAREFIDSGLWVIDCLYQYLGYTGDYELLKEECGYINIEGNIAHILNKKDSILNHLYLITNYLISNIDSKTKCLKTLYGDWNDAVDGLGKGKDYEGFGNGVSIMATFQLYSALNKMIDIVKHFDKENTKLLNEYNHYKNELIKGLNEHAFTTNNQESKIIHGWGKDESFYVGSFKDVDNKSRDSLTSNAFYVISGFYKENDKYIDSVIKAYKRLDSKYGLKTFMPGFNLDAIDVGRIVNLPIGTAENGSVYIHGTIFAIDSLFSLGEDKFAWEQIYKVIPITHKYVSTTPFIMPNSYINSKEIDVDGESMNDWFTGSSSTLIKSLIRNAFGIKVTLDEILIETAKYFPFKKASISLKILQKSVILTHFNNSSSKRIIKINGKEITNLTNDFYKKGIYKIPIKEFLNYKDKIEIEVID